MFRHLNYLRTHITLDCIFLQSLCRYAALLMSLLPEDDVTTQQITPTTTTATTSTKSFSSRDTHCKLYVVVQFQQTETL